MGFIRSAAEGLDSANDVMKEQKALIESLAQLAQTKADYFELDIEANLRSAGTSENSTIPIEAVIASKLYTHAYSASESDRIGDNVKEALKSFCPGSTGNIVDGVGALIGNTLTTFLGRGEAGESTIQEYYVMTEGLSIIRIDLRAWQRTVEGSGITNKIEKVSAFVAVKSAVDLTKIKFNTFLSIYANQLAAAEHTLGSANVKAALDEARDIYEIFAPPGVSVPELPRSRP